VKGMAIQETRSDRAFFIAVNIILGVLMVITLYPFLYTLSSSISDPYAVAKRQVVLWPKGFSLVSYKMVLNNSEIYQYYYNTLWYVVVGTTINVFMTLIAAYPLSRRKFFLRNQIMMFIAFTMFFSGGLIPTFLLVRGLGLYNTRWAIVLPTAVEVWNIIITRTYMQSTIPDSLCESATIDGANDLAILWKIVLPLSKPIIAVILLFSAVAHWNSFFPALIYLSDKSLHPMQLFLRRVLLIVSEELVASAQGTSERSVIGEQIRYTVIMVTIIPIICVYPFLQKYFVKGVMIGAIKG
jgi:putative aldouronate transport system permease protein